MNDQPKRKSRVDIAKELNIIAQGKLDLADKILKFANEESKRTEELLQDSDDQLLLDKIHTLRMVMVSQFGDNKYSSESLGASQRVFNDDDILPLKGKMLELIKQL